MDELKQAVSDILDTMLGYYRQPDGTFTYEIYADYRDEMDSKTAIRILQSLDPMEAFWEQLDEWYSDYEWQLRSDLERELERKLTAADGVFPEGLPDDASSCCTQCYVQNLRHHFGSWTESIKNRRSFHFQKEISISYNQGV